MKHDSPMLKRIKQAQKSQQNAKPISSTMMDKMVDGREFSSLLGYQFTDVDLIKEIRKSIKEIHDVRGKPIVCYVSNVVRPSSEVGIDSRDDLPFNEMIRGISPEEKELDIVLVTPGGFANQVAKFVNALRPRFEKVSFILLNQAMSAGTIFALSGDEIIMSKESQIGPIDPQVRNNNGDFIPAQSLSTLIEEIRIRGEEKVKKKEPIPWTDIQILKSIDMKDVGNSISASKYSIQLTEGYLNDFKFKTWLKHKDDRNVTDEERKSRSKEIAQLLCDHSKWKSHGHAITRDAAWDVCKLKISHAEDLNLERPMRRMWALFYWIFDTQPIVKLFISDNYVLVRNTKKI